MDKDLELRISNMLAESQKLIDILTKENERKDLIIADQKTELITWDMVSNSDDWMEMTAIAKALNYPGYGRNKLFEFLRENSILRYNNEPYQQFVDRGYFKIIEQRVDLPYGDVKINRKTVVSQKGLDYMRKKLDEQLD